MTVPKRIIDKYMSHPPKLLISEFEKGIFKLDICTAAEYLLNHFKEA